MKKISCHWIVPNHRNKVRADIYLKQHIGRISRNQAAKIIDNHDFLLNDQISKPSTKVFSGQKVTLWRAPPDDKNDIDNVDISILYEDDNILAINKPAGLTIHPTANCLYKTLTYWLKVTYPKVKINPCHRIDRDTSGIVICAKNKITESKIKKAFMYGHVNKIYIAIVSGIIKRSQFITIPLAQQKDRGLVAIRMIKDINGLPSITQIRPIVINKAYDRTMLLCKPMTGRQHQIRAHLSLIGHSIVGDKLYGKDDIFFNNLYIKNHSQGRHALHAFKIAFIIDDKKYIIKSNLPNELLSLINSNN